MPRGAETLKPPGRDALLRLKEEEDPKGILQATR